MVGLTFYGCLLGQLSNIKVNAMLQESETYHFWTFLWSHNTAKKQFEEIFFNYTFKGAPSDGHTYFVLNEDDDIGFEKGASKHFFILSLSPLWMIHRN